MKTINIGNMILSKRKEKNITQEQLAEYIGVSKASVSKWETGLSYPDITLIPELATYFNITIDELIGYTPQLTKEDIKKTYLKLSQKINTDTFQNVINECHVILKKYYSCFPLLFHMAAFFINNCSLAKTDEERTKLMNEAIQLCQRVRLESDDVALKKDAISLEATCYIILNKPIETLNLVGEKVKPLPQDIELIGQAYQLLGNMEKANEVFQVAMYQHLLSFIGDSGIYLKQNMNDLDVGTKTIERILKVIDLYEIDKLHPNTAIQTYLCAAEVYSFHNMVDRAIEMLEKYKEVVYKYFFPITLHGDQYFDLVGNWIKEFDLGDQAPRSEALIKESLLWVLEKNPFFAPLQENTKYKQIVISIKERLGGK